MSNISGEGTLNGQIFGATDVIDYDNLTNRPKINNKVVEGEHAGRYYDLTESEIIDWIDYAALPEETKKNGKIYYIRNVGTYEEKTISNVTVASFNDGTPNPLVSLKIDIVADQEGSGDPSLINPRPINGYNSIDVIVSPTLNPEAGTTTTISLGQTVYGGKLNVTTGELTVDRLMITTNENTPWTGGAASNKYRWNYVWGSTNLSKPYNVDGDKRVSSMFKQDSTVYFDSASNVGFTTNNNALFVRFNDSAYNTQATVQSALNGATFVYPLGTPTTVFLTPTQIYSLLGANNIWTDEGEIINELKYLSSTGNIENQIRYNDEIFARA